MQSARWHRPRGGLAHQTCRLTRSPATTAGTATTPARPPLATTTIAASPASASTTARHEIPLLEGGSEDGVTFFHSFFKRFLRETWGGSFLFPLRTRAKFHRLRPVSGMLPRRRQCGQRRERQAVMRGCATRQCAVGGARLGALPPSSGPEDRALACSCMRSTGAELQRMRVGEGWCSRRARWHRD